MILDASQDSELSSQVAMKQRNLLITLLTYSVDSLIVVNHQLLRQAPHLP